MLPVRGSEIKKFYTQLNGKRVTMGPLHLALSPACETNHLNGDYMENDSARAAIHLGQKTLARLEKSHA